MNMFGGFNGIQQFCVEIFKISNRGINNSGVSYKFNENVYVYGFVLNYYSFLLDDKEKCFKQESNDEDRK